MVKALKNREEHRVLLHNASWGTYERLLAEREEPVLRASSTIGGVEILSPSAEHDRISRIFATLVELLAEEANIDVDNAESTTF